MEIDLKKAWSILEEERYIQVVEHRDPDLDLLAKELDVYWPELGSITCSQFTWAWIREATDGVVYQYGEKSGSPIFVYYSPKQDGFYGCQVYLDNAVPRYKVRIKKVE